VRRVQEVARGGARLGLGATASGGGAAARPGGYRTPGTAQEVPRMRTVSTASFPPEASAPGVSYGPRVKALSV
jgi:hypothetical protein